MKILQVIDSVRTEGGGPIEAVTQMSQSLTEGGHVVEIASLDAADAACILTYSMPVHALGPGYLGYAYSPRLVPWLSANAHAYDVVIVHGIWQYHCFGAWRALRKSATPYVVFTHGMLDPWFKRRYPLKHLKKWIYWPWSNYPALRDAGAVIFTCDEERILARQSFWLYAAREEVMNFGTASPDGEPGAQREAFLDCFPHLREKRLITFMGRIHPKKGCDVVVEAFARTLAKAPSWHLVIAGPDQVGWQADLVRQAEQLDIANHITWTGMLKGSVKWGALRSSEALVLPSHQENFGIVVAEALACGVPVLISDKVNIWREIQQDGAGFVGPDTSDGTCSLLDRWSQMSDEQRLSMARKARQCFERRFEINAGAQSLIRILTAVTRN